jgi:hypothetical protein
MNYFAELSGIIRFFDVYSETVNMANYSFKDCIKMECIDMIYIPNATSTIGFLSGCRSLRMIPKSINVNSSKSVDEFFMACASLKEVYEVRTNMAKSMRKMFKNCSNLVRIGNLDFSHCSDTTDMFMGCPSLQYVGIVPNSLNTHISFANTKLSITSLRFIINSAINVGVHKEIDITNTPAARDLTSDDESAVAVKGWTLKY